MKYKSLLLLQLLKDIIYARLMITRVFLHETVEIRISSQVHIGNEDSSDWN